MAHDPETIMAYVDGELAPADAQAFEAEMASDPALTKQVAAERALRARLGARFDAVLDEPVPDRLAALLQPKGEVIDFAAAKEQRERRRWLPGWANAGAVAASLAVGVVGGQMLVRAPAMVASRDGGLYAGPKLEKALDTQLASVQPTDAPIRIGLTFRDGGGAVCRTFDGEGLAGVACHSGKDWTVRRTIADEVQPGATDYRQASSAAAMAAAQEIMAGEPFDAAQEKAARDKGWR